MFSILPNQYKYKGAESKTLCLKANLQNQNHLVQESQFNEVVNQYNQYLTERETCSKIRLTVQVNLVATNVLFNRFTEVVKYEDDSTKRTCLNFTPKQISTSYFKSAKKWGKSQIDLTRDTQLTSCIDNEKNYTYHCGVDIFNNHIMRSKSKWSPYMPASSNIAENFNTIEDVKRISAYQIAAPNKSTETATNNKLHVYNSDNIYSYLDCIDKRLEIKNGWFGFINRGKMPFAIENGNDEVNVHSVLNNIPLGQFVDLYPGREYYSLLPYYNKVEHRKEDNWEYCITYPYSSTTQGFEYIINPSLNTLRIMFIDESTEDSDGLQKTTIYSLVKHGLQPDDLVNIYRSDEEETQHELVEENVIVDSVVDDFTFVVYMSEPICDNWINIYDNDSLKEILGEKYQSASNAVIANGHTYYAFNGYINADLDGVDIGSQNLSFAKVSNGLQCRYYVRIFSRFPNFELFQSGINEKNIYEEINGSKPIDKYAEAKYEKTSSFTNLGFAKNAYGDNMAQIVYNDDIDINFLHDNLGRPLTNLYLSFFKTNYGHKEWYNNEMTSKNIEHSHCFGKLSCGLEYNPYSVNFGRTEGNIHTITNTNFGYLQTMLRDVDSNYDADEIVYKKQRLFYGDLCCYNADECKEEVLDIFYNRFNTQQRELKSTTLKGRYSDLGYSYLNYDEIGADDSSWYFFISTTTADRNPISVKEGYYYQPHYKIPIRAISGNLSELKPIFYKLNEFTIDESSICMIKTSEVNYIDRYDRLFLYDLTKKIAIECKIVNILSTTVLTFTSDDLSKVVDGDINLDNYRVYITPVEVPSYATMAEDGSGTLKWREIFQNGFEDTLDAIPQYPYTNGCLYVNKRINIFLRRQDPFGEYGLLDEFGSQISEGYESPYRKVLNGESGVDNTSYDESSTSC